MVYNFRSACGSDETALVQSDYNRTINRQTLRFVEVANEPSAVGSSQRKRLRDNSGRGNSRGVLLRNKHLRGLSFDLSCLWSLDDY